MPLPPLSPLPLERRRDPFDSPDHIYEWKVDGYRALAFLERGKVQLVSRRGHVFKKYPDLCALLARCIKARTAIVDGELAVLDAAGRSQFLPLLRGDAEPCFAAFDLLWLNGRDQRGLPLLERKKRLRRILPRRSNCVLYVNHVAKHGVALFREVGASDLEGIVAKPAQSSYRLVGGKSPWTKIKSPTYSQGEGRPTGPRGGGGARPGARRGGRAR